MSATEALTATLGEAVSKAVAARLDAATIDGLVAKYVDELVINSIKSALAFGDNRRLIEKAIEESLRVNSLNLPAYGEIVAQMLKAQIEARVSEVVAGKLAEDMNELLSLAPKEVKLSDIAKAMLDELGDEAVNTDPVITVMLDEASYGSRWLYLDESEHHSDREKFQCRHSLLLREDGTIASARIDQKEAGSGKLWIGRGLGLAQLLRAYAACGTKIILDEDMVELSRGYD